MKRFAYFCGHEQWHPEQVVRHAVLAEQAGFDMLVVSEHFHPWVDDASASGFSFSTLGAVAEATARIEITTGVTTPFVEVPSRHRGPGRRHARSVERRAVQPRRGHRREPQRRSAGIPLPQVCGAGGPYVGGARHHEAPAGRRETLLRRRLLHTTDRAKLYSPPVSRIPILLAAGGPKTAGLAGRKADGIIVSVKDPAVALERVIGPARESAAEAGRPRPVLLTSRWSILAGSDDEAWEALYSWRGLRAPGRLQAVDPMTLRKRADDLPREDILGRYARATRAEDIVNLYLPLVGSVDADIVTIQMASVDQEGLIELLGREVLPALREAAAG